VALALGLAACLTDRPQSKQFLFDFFFDNSFTTCSGLSFDVIARCTTTRVEFDRRRRRGKSI
jgi:hypothetical protein